jgi:hypothetical protein
MLVSILYPASGQAGEDSLDPQGCQYPFFLHWRNFLICPFLSQEHLIYAGEHLYPAAGQAGEYSLASKGCQHSFCTGKIFLSFHLVIGTS